MKFRLRDSRKLPNEAASPVASENPPIEAPATATPGRHYVLPKAIRRELRELGEFARATLGADHIYLTTHLSGAPKPHIWPATALNRSLLYPQSQTVADRRAGPTQSALYAREAVTIADVSAESRWPSHRVATLAAGMRACWAIPIDIPGHTTVASLTLYFRAPRPFTEADEGRISVLSPLLGKTLSKANEPALAAANSRRDFDSLANTIPGCVYQRVVYPDGSIKYLYINDYSREIFGLSPKQILENPEALFESFTPEYRKVFRRKLLEASKAMKTWDVEASIITADGRTKFTHAIAKPKRQPDGSVLWTGVILDATRIKQAEEAAAAAEERTRNAIVESLSQGFLLYDANDQLVIRNSHFVKLYPFLKEIAQRGASYSEIVRAELSRNGELDITKGSLGEAFSERIAQHHNRTSVHEYQIAADRWIQVNEHRTEDGGTAVIYTDVSELKRRERRIQHLAHHDALTGLANRILFRQRVEEALMRVETRGGMIGVLCLDLDHFKNINDTLGHPAGDTLLKEVSRRLENCIRECDTASRLGGDEFAIVVSDLPSAEFTTNLAWRILGALAEPVEINGQLVYTGTSIGIALSGTRGLNADTLVKNADLALYRAKSDGRGTFRYYETEMDARAQERRALEIDLRKAVAFGQLELHYQPLVDVESNRILSMEALVRWRHPERGLVPPGEFIGIAEETGIIVQLGDWVLTKACRDAVNWPEHIGVAINLSPAQFRNRELADKIIRTVTQSGLNPKRLELEITESLLFRDTEANLATLSKLKEFGVQIAMDDFGTGYSSLSNLRSFPFDKIKIDRSFVAEMSKSSDSQTIIQAMLNLGRSLGMKTTAEGVESLEQVAYLRSQGCTEVQGFFYSAPIPGHAVADMLQLDSIADIRGKRSA